MFRKILKLASLVSAGERSALVSVGTFLITLASDTTVSVSVLRNFTNCQAASGLWLLRATPMTLPTTNPEPYRSGRLSATGSGATPQSRSAGSSAAIDAIRHSPSMFIAT